MKRIMNFVLVCLVCGASSLWAQDKNTTTASTETTTTTVAINNGKEIKHLKKEVTITKENALVLDEKDKNKVNQSFKEVPVKTTKTTILKDGDEIVSKEVEVFYAKGDDKYILNETHEDVSYTTSNLPDNSYPIKDNDKDGICYFTPEGSFCVEFRDEASGTMDKEIYILEENN